MLLLAVLFINTINFIIVINCSDVIDICIIIFSASLIKEKAAFFLGITKQIMQRTTEFSELDMNRNSTEAHSRRLGKRWWRGQQSAHDDAVDNIDIIFVIDVIDAIDIV